MFIRCFFQGQGIEDIGHELEVAPNTVASHYRHTVERLKEALALADDRQATRDRYESLLKRNDARFGKLAKGQRWWVMNRVLGQTVPEIAGIDCANSRKVNHAIKAVSDRIITGQTILTNPRPDEVIDAKARIDRKRQRDSQRHQRKAV